VLISPGDLESAEETLAVLSDLSLAGRIRESKMASPDGDMGSGLDELRAGLSQRRASQGERWSLGAGGDDASPPGV